MSTLGGLVKNALREPDVVARYGGEEFLVICVNTSVDGAGLVAERLRSLIESHPVEIPDDGGERKAIQISISIGVAGLSDSRDGKDQLIQAADKALYRAKQEGRKHIIIATFDDTGTAAAGTPISGLA